MFSSTTKNSFTTRMTLATEIGRVVSYTCFLKSRDKLKTFYLCYQSAYGHQTWQNCNLWWWAPIHKVTWHFEYVILKNYVTNWNYVSLTKVPMVNNFFGGDGNSPGWALTHKVTWPFNHEVLQNHVTN